MSLRHTKPSTSEVSTQYWDFISANIADGPVNTVWRRHSDTVNELLLTRWLNKNKYQSVLKTDLFDESIGEGLCSFLSDYSDEIHGVDISEVCVEAASARYPALQTEKADVRDLPFPNQYFDCVVSNSTLDHFQTREDIDTSLREIHRVLRPAGELIVTLDNLQNPIIWLRSVLPNRWLNRIGLLPYFVGETLTMRGLRNMLTKAGYEIKESTVILHCPRVAAIPVSDWIQKHRPGRSHERWLKFLMSFEWLARTPLCYLTGHFVAIHAIKPDR